MTKHNRNHPPSQRIFTTRLLGFRNTITPAAVASYNPVSGLSNVLWSPFPDLQIYIDPTCILLRIAGRHHAPSNSFTFGIFHSHKSFLNRCGKLLLGPSRRTWTRHHAELSAVEEALLQVLSIVEDPWCSIVRSVVLVTDSTRLMHGLSSCVNVWKENGWKRLRGKPISNAEAWKAILALVERIEWRGVGVRVWMVAEGFNGDATALAVGVEIGRLSRETSLTRNRLLAWRLVFYTMGAFNLHSCILGRLVIQSRYKFVGSSEVLEDYGMHVRTGNIPLSRLLQNPFFRIIKGFFLLDVLNAVNMSSILISKHQVLPSEACSHCREAAK